MQRLNCIIIDDEPIARNILKDYIQRDDRLLLLQEYSKASDALREFAIHKPHLIFLDIKMPGINGFEMIRSLPQHPQVIFTTAFREYAVEGFNLNAADYLLKPFSFERFLQAVNKVYLLLSYEQGYGMAPSAIKPSADTADIFVKSNGMLVRVQVSDILYIEALKEYVRIVTHNSQLVVNQTMQYMEGKLPKDLFFRIHRSYIVGLSHIHAIEGNCVRVGDVQLPVSRYCRDDFIELVAKNKLL